MGYSIGQVRELLKLPPGSSTGTAEKILGRLGDRFSIAITKIYTQQQLQDPENMKRYLPMMAMTFAAPATITPEDREPKVTTFLLEFLKSQMTNPSLKAEVANAEAIVQRETVSR